MSKIERVQFQKFKMFDFKLFLRPFSRLHLYIEIRVRLMNPKEKCLYVQDWATLLAGLVGCEVTNPNYKPYWFTLFPGLIILDFLVFGMYTIAHHVKMKDYIKCFQVVCIMGSIIPVTFKWLLHYTYITYITYLQIKKYSFRN